MPPIAGQLYDGIRYEGPNGSANHVSGLPQLIDLSKGSLKGVGTEVLDHRQRGPQGFDVVQMEHYRYSLPEIGHGAYASHLRAEPISETAVENDLIGEVR